MTFHLNFLKCSLKGHNRLSATISKTWAISRTPIKRDGTKTRCFETGNMTVEWKYESVLREICSQPQCDETWWPENWIGMNYIVTKQKQAGQLSISEHINTEIALQGGDKALFCLRRLNFNGVGVVANTMWQPIFEVTDKNLMLPLPYWLEVPWVGRFETNTF